MEQDLVIFSAITDMLVHIQDNRATTKHLHQPIQWAIAWYVRKSELEGSSIDATSLATATGHARNSVVKHIDTLIKAGYIVTTPDPRNYRRKVLNTTPKLRTDLERFAKDIAPSIVKASLHIQNIAWKSLSK